MQKFFMFPKGRKGKRPELFMILDTETATLPYANEIAKNEEEKKKIAISKPLIYNIGWRIIDRKNNVYSEHSYLVSEIFSVPAVFNTAYYKDKKPFYLEKLREGTIKLLDWNSIANILYEELLPIASIGAFNSMFDFKKAIPFTESYIKALYSDYFYEWEKKQEYSCKAILHNRKKESDNDFDKYNFNFRDLDIPMFDIWGIACRNLLDTTSYRRFCFETNALSPSKIYFSTNAQNVYRYINKDYDFLESHTALEDVIIESEILLKALKKTPLKIGIDYFPFKTLGETPDYLLKGKKTRIRKEKRKEYAQAIVNELVTQLESKKYSHAPSYETKLIANILKLKTVCDE